ncbi:MAG: SUMF1/EgtB/PvdO family nonheme iron enzyme [Labilithrix sp.]|nr:SUMF1/EgtB/PvdO family nonheme iron enzyme [Labilithrix sp.]MCW5813701.1 SUMF1/EgtB/PvdO family nonheme iron enzyme [Labilithrix sp.]
MTSSRQVFRRAFVFAIGSVLVGCAMVAGIDGFRIGECKGGNCDRDGEAPPPPPPPDVNVPVVDTGVPCVGRGTPTAIRVGTPPNTFCIDTTEVTNADYKVFLDAGVNPATQGGTCLWNKTYQPSYPVSDPDAGMVVPAPADDAPVTNVDWCDAVAFCQWAGKYLCGAVEDGKKIGPVSEADLLNFKANQWLLACSAEARLRFPYGGVFDGTKCNLADLGEGGVLPVGSLPGCQGGYQGLFDMVGNVREWFDGPCKPPPDSGAPDAAGPEADTCILKGGAFDNGGGTNGPVYGCGFDEPSIRRDHQSGNTGFRCCSD